MAAWRSSYSTLTFTARPGGEYVQAFSSRVEMTNSMRARSADTNIAGSEHSADTCRFFSWNVRRAVSTQDLARSQTLRRSYLYAALVLFAASVSSTRVFVSL